MGKILRVDLSSGKITEEFPDDAMLKLYLGGSGIATKYLIDETPKGIDPLGPENKLIFMTGPLTGTPSPSTGRYCVVAKSPLTRVWGEATREHEDPRIRPARTQGDTAPRQTHRHEHRR